MALAKRPLRSLLAGRTAIPQFREQSLLTAVRNGSRNIAFAFGSPLPIVILVAAAKFRSGPKVTCSEKR
jgi:hypothetical protein